MSELLPILEHPEFAPKVLRVNLLWYRPATSGGDFKVVGDVLVARGNNEVRENFAADSLGDLARKISVFLEREKHRDSQLESFKGMRESNAGGVAE